MTKKILIIEEDDENRNLFRDILTISGYEMLEARNGMEGIRIAKAEKPHLILIDIQMPVMNGIEALRILKSDVTTKDIPSIALTSLRHKEGKNGFLKFGFIDCIEKPIELKEFIRMINKYLRHYFKD